MILLNEKEIVFAKDDSGMLCCKLADGGSRSNVHCISLFPLSMPENYVSVLAGVDADGEEIGIIQCLDDFAEDQIKLISDAVAERYFVPEILDIEVLETRRGGGGGRRGGGGGHGFHEWRVSTDRGTRTLHLYNAKESISVNSVGTVLITDIEKNRYKISDTSILPPKARRILDDMLL